MDAEREVNRPVESILSDIQQALTEYEAACEEVNERAEELAKARQRAARVDVRISNLQTELRKAAPRLFAGLEERRGVEVG